MIKGVDSVYVRRQFDMEISAKCAALKIATVQFCATHLCSYRPVSQPFFLC